jgi:hypothetical protein
VPPYPAPVWISSEGCYIMSEAYVRARDHILSQESDKKERMGRIPQLSLRTYPKEPRIFHKAPPLKGVQQHLPVLLPYRPSFYTQYFERHSCRLQQQARCETCTKCQRLSPVTVLISGIACEPTFFMTSWLHIVWIDKGDFVSVSATFHTELLQNHWTAKLLKKKEKRQIISIRNLKWSVVTDSTTVKKDKIYTYFQTHDIFLSGFFSLLLLCWVGVHCWHLQRFLQCLPTFLL